MSALTRFLSKLFGGHGPPAVLRVRVQRTVLEMPHQADVYVIAVLNQSLEQSVTITNVWLETAVRISVLTKPLPVTVAPQEQWETWIEVRELPPGTTDVEHKARVALADGRIVASTPG